MKKFSILIIVLTLLLTKNCCAEETTEYKLASINAGKPISHNDATIDRFRYLLQAIQEKTIVSEPNPGVSKVDGIASAIVYTRDNIQKEYGVKINLLEYTEGYNRYLNRLNQRLGFTETLALYALTLGKEYG